CQMCAWCCLKILMSRALFFTPIMKAKRGKKFCPRGRRPCVSIGNLCVDRYVCADWWKKSMMQKPTLIMLPDRAAAASAHGLRNNRARLKAALHWKKRWLNILQNMSWATFHGQPIGQVFASGRFRLSSGMTVHFACMIGYSLPDQILKVSGIGSGFTHKLLRRPPLGGLLSN